MKPRAAIFFYDGYVGVQPSVAGALNGLTDLGYEVDLFIASPFIPTPPAGLGAGVRVHQLRPWTRVFSDYLLSRLRRPRLATQPSPQNGDITTRAPPLFKTLMQALLFIVELPSLVLFIKQRIKDPTLIIAFDITSFMMGWPFSKIRPFVYWSLEITPRGEIRDPINKLIKMFELTHINKVSALVTQAEERTALLAHDMSITIPVFHIPNAPYSDLIAADNGRFFRDRFNIPDDQTIVLHAGQITSAFMSQEIASAAASWPEQYTLIFHERQRRVATEPYVAAVHAAGQGRALLSLEPLPLDSVGRAYAGANVGIVGYDESNANVASAWASSGKLSYYLKYGLPVVLVTPVRPRLLDARRFGLWVRDPAEIGSALDEITANYPTYRRAALESYAALFDFKSAFLAFHRAIVRACPPGLK